MPKRTDNVSFGPGHGHRFLRVLIVLMAVVTLATFAASMAWPFELLSHFRPHYAVILVGLSAAALAFRAWKIGLIAVAALLVHLNVMLPEWSASPELDAAPAGGLKIYYANVRTANLQIDQVTRQLGIEQPDVAVLLETDERWVNALKDMQGSLPYRFSRPHEGNFAMTVMSKTDLLEVRAFELAGVTVPAISAQIEFGDRDLRILAVHTIPPASPQGLKDRDRQLADLAARVTAETMPVIVVGDLNCSPWAPAFKELLTASGLKDSRRGFGVQATWPSFLGAFGIPIDHVLVDPRLAVYERRIGDAMGSDHLPIITRVGERGSH